MSPSLEERTGKEVTLNSCKKQLIRDFFLLFFLFFPFPPSLFAPSFFFSLVIDVRDKFEATLLIFATRETRFLPKNAPCLTSNLHFNFTEPRKLSRSLKFADFGRKRKKEREREKKREKLVEKGCFTTCHPLAPRGVCPTISSSEMEPCRLPEIISPSQVYFPPSTTCKSPKGGYGGAGTVHEMDFIMVIDWTREAIAAGDTPRGTRLLLAAPSGTPSRWSLITYSAGRPPEGARSFGARQVVPAELLGR